MDWDRAIEINQTALARIVAGLIAMVGLVGGVMPVRVPRIVFRAALGVLRPAESAVGRLIVIVARGIAVKPRPVRTMPAGLVLSRGGNPCASFQLFDARKRFGLARRRAAGRGAEPCIRILGSGPLVPLFQPRVEAVAASEPDDGMVGAARLGRRLTALKAALEDLPAQAKRLKRWQARRDRMAAPKFTSPLRPGRPPGYREKPKEEVELVLRECHALALDVLNAPSPHFSSSTANVIPDG